MLVAACSAGGDDDEEEGGEEDDDDFGSTSAAANVAAALDAALASGRAPRSPFPRVAAAAATLLDDGPTPSSFAVLVHSPHDGSSRER